MDGWAVNKTSVVSWPRQLKEQEPLSGSIAAVTTSEAAKPLPESIDAVSTGAVTSEAAKSRPALMDAVSIDAVTMSEAAAPKMAETVISRQPKPFQPWEGYHKECCQSFNDTGFDDEEVLKHLYGEQFNINDTSGHGEIVVLGNQNSGMHPHVSSSEAPPATD